MSDIFLNTSYEVAGFNVLQSICNHISEIFKKFKSIETLAKLRKMVAASSNKAYIDSGTEEDSVEFFEILLDEVRKEIPEINIQAHNLLREFRGVEKTERKFLNNTNGICSRCRKLQRIHEEYFQTIKITIPTTSNCSVFQLSHLLNCHFSEDATVIKMKCGNCCTHVKDCPKTGVCRLKDSVSHTSILQSPNKLIVQLERFTYDNSKVQNLVTVENVIQLAGETYYLKACVDHICETMQNGHYIVHIKSDNNWIKFDDSFVTNQTEKEAKTNNIFFLYTKVIKEIDSGHMNEGMLSEPHLISEMTTMKKNNISFSVSSSSPMSLNRGFVKIHKESDNNISRSSLLTKTETLCNKKCSKCERIFKNLYMHLLKAKKIVNLHTTWKK